MFDECHKAKNLKVTGTGKKTRTAEVVHSLQATLPRARILYASATGASEARNLAYMSRLGAGGFSSMESFVSSIESLGLGK